MIRRLIWWFKWRSTEKMLLVMEQSFEAGMGRYEYQRPYRKPRRYN